MNDPRYNAVPAGAEYCAYVGCGLALGHDGPHKAALDVRADRFVTRANELRGRVDLGPLGNLLRDHFPRSTPWNREQAQVAIEALFAERLAVMDRYDGKEPGYYASLSAEAAVVDAVKRLCEAEGHDWGEWRDGARSAQGTQTRYCQRACGEWETEPIPTKFPAPRADAEIVIPPGKTSEGS